MNPTDTTEKGLETLIVRHLTGARWLVGRGQLRRRDARRGRHGLPDRQPAGL
jgi:hypothetical protein